MKNSHQIHRQYPERYKSIIGYDMSEIDNPDPRSSDRLNYLDRISQILSLVRHYFPDGPHTAVFDFACAQGNVGLLLAEAGYRVVLVDMNDEFIEYSKAKYEHGCVQWRVADVSKGLLDGQFDVIVLGEFIEHCAYPEDILENASRSLKTGGIMVVSTPNGEAARQTLPLFGDVASRGARQVFVSRQFGPGGGDHLFLFRLNDLDRIVPQGVRIIERGYTGGSTRLSPILLRRLPPGACSLALRMMSKVPILNRRVFNNIFAVMRKVS